MAARMFISLLFILIGLLVLSGIFNRAVSHGAESTYFDCVVTKVDAKMFIIKCDAPNPNSLCQLPKNKENEECKYTVLDVPAENWNEFQAWHYQTNNDPWHPPVKQLRPKLGQILRGAYVMGQFMPMKPCAVRGYEAIQQYCKGKSYCRPPLGLATPYDCGKNTSSYIKLLQEQALKGM